MKRLGLLLVFLLVGTASAEPAPPWSVSYGDEFWRRGDGLDVGDAVDRVSHAIDAGGHSGAVAFDRRGVRLGSERVRTARVTVGERVVYRASRRAWAIVGNTAQRSLAPGLVEHVEVLAEGVAITWVLRDPPPQGDALVVELEVGAHVRVGPAALVDANGRRWPVTAEPSGRRIRWRVDPSILAGAAFPVALDPVLTDELAMPAPVPSARAGAQIDPWIASNGSGYLIVWQDFSVHPSSILAARLAADGTLIDRDAIHVASSTAYLEGAPAVASNGTDYLVTWGEQTIYGNRVTAAGEVLDGEGFAIVTGTWLLYPRIASNGTDYLVTWLAVEGDHEPNKIYGGRVTAAGAVLDTSGVALTTADSSQGVPRVASNGEEYMVVWPDSRGGIYGGRVTADGALLDGDGFLVAAGQGDPAVASDGTGYFVAWTDGDVHGAYLTATGARDGEVLSLGETDGNQLDAEVTWNGSDYLVVWDDKRETSLTIGGALVAAGTSTTLFATPGTPNGVRRPRVASAGGDAVVVWTDERNSGSLGDIFADVYAGVVSSTGATTGTGAPVALGPSAQGNPAVASNGTVYLVVWQEYRLDTGDDIYATRVSPAGVVLDPDGFAITTAPYFQTSPAVASNGTDFFVGWTSFAGDNGHVQPYRIVGARVSGVGEVLDPDGIALNESDAEWMRPSVASNGTDYLVAWTQYVDHTPYNDLRAARVAAATGEVLDPGGAIIAATPAFFASVASNGTDYLVAWYAGVSGNAALRASRISSHGAVAVLDATPLEIATGSLYYSQGQYLASNGTDYLVAWSGAGVHAQRIAANGVLVGGDLTLDADAAEYARPVVASAGGDFFVAWQDARTDTDRDVYATTVSAEGVVGSPAAVSATAVDEVGPELVGQGPRADYLVVYAGDLRTRARLVCDGACPAVDVDVDECAAMVDDCGDHATCSNTLGGFTCACDAGFQGDGHVCTAETPGDPDAGVSTGDPDAGAGPGPGDEDAGVDVGDVDAGDDDGPGAETDDAAGCCSTTTDPRGAAILALLCAALLGTRRRR